jgi:hypothetical protein
MRQKIKSAPAEAGTIWTADDEREIALKKAVGKIWLNRAII